MTTPEEQARQDVAGWGEMPEDVHTALDRWMTTGDASHAEAVCDWIDTQPGVGPEALTGDERDDYNGAMWDALEDRYATNASED